MSSESSNNQLLILPAGFNKNGTQIFGKVEDNLGLLPSLGHKVVQQCHAGLVGLCVHKLSQRCHLETQGVASIATLEMDSNV